MHILESVSHDFVCIPVVHEVSAGIAAEYFNEISDNGKAFALVTAGPGLTNIVTAFAGAWLESRELLVIGGQVKSSDLMIGNIRQNGIQEIDGISIVKSISNDTMRIEQPVAFEVIQDIVNTGRTGRKGPVFIEFCLDAQAAAFESKSITSRSLDKDERLNPNLDLVLNKIASSSRPVLLIGGGVDRKTSTRLRESIKNLGMPVMTTWNGADRISALSSNYFGRPNTWGQRYSNIILQQSDLLIAVGTRLGLQQTGFNWESFLPLGQIIQVDLDEFELQKENPKVDFPVKADANQFLDNFMLKFESHRNLDWDEWMLFASTVRDLCPIIEQTNQIQSADFVNTYQFFDFLSNKVKFGESLIPSSSGSAETVAMQVFKQIDGNYVVTNKGLASMGYGLAGAVGAALATNSRVFHVEGDGGFSQNLQELGTVSAQQLPIKSFILCNDGYASIRMTQSNYFDGHYVGCDPSTGLGLPDWEKLFDAFGIASLRVTSSNLYSDEVARALASPHPHGFLVQIDPNQTYFPKIASKIQTSGLMVSNPIHLMTPQLDKETEKTVFKYFPNESGHDE